jgi:hypothetical protein
MNAPQLLKRAVTLAAALTFAGAGTASADTTPMATAGVTYLQESFATISFSLVAQGTPSAADGRFEYRRVADGFDAQSSGVVTCYLQIGNRGYFSGQFDRPFLSGPTEVLFFNGVVVDGDGAGEADSAAVMLGADAPIPCNEVGTMSFLDAIASPIVRGNVVMH